MNKISKGVPCLNPEAHGVTSHIAGSAAAIACQQTHGRSTKMAHIVAPPRAILKGNNIGNISVLTNISEEALEWGKNNIRRDTPRDVASLIEVTSSNSNMANNYRDFCRPFINMIHDEEYSDEFGENSLLPNPTDLGFSFQPELNDQTRKIVEQSDAPGFRQFIEAAASEMDTSSETAASAYKVIAGYLSNNDYAKVYAVGCLRSEYMEREQEKKNIDEQLKAIAAIFNEEVDDGVQTEKHGIEFLDGAGVQFTPRRVFNYDDAAPQPIPSNASDEEKALLAKGNKERLSEAEYKSIIKNFDPTYKALGEIKKLLPSEQFDKFVGFGSTALSVK